MILTMLENLNKNILNNLEKNSSYIELYKNFKNETLELIFSSLHAKLINLLELMNEKLPTENFFNYYPAQKSRDFIFIIEQIDELQDINTVFKLDDYYKEIIDNLIKILKPKAGSSIRPNTKKIEIYYDKPIFIKK